MSLSLTHEPCSNETEQNIDKDNDDQPINNRDSIKRQDVDHQINENRPILLSCNNCKRSQSKELIEKYGNDSPYFISFRRHGTHQVRSRRKFKFVPSVRSEEQSQEIILCFQCVKS